MRLTLDANIDGLSQVDDGDFALLILPEMGSVERRWPPRSPVCLRVARVEIWHLSRLKKAPILGDGVVKPRHGDKIHKQLAPTIAHRRF